MNDQISKAHLTVTCWGCNKSVTKSYSDYNNSLSQLESLLIEGWVKRYFARNRWSWFCSHDCAYFSAHAKQAEQWYKEYRQKTIPWLFIVPSAIILVCLAIAIASIFMR
jgi:hypothetical protein